MMVSSQHSFEREKERVVIDLVAEQTSEAASSGESALSNHTHFAEQLWDQSAAILERVTRGLESTEQLTDFFKGRKKAEEEAAKHMRMMCITTGELNVGGRLGSTALNRLGANRLLGASAELADVLCEPAGSVRTAWGSLIYETKTTANAHSDLANALQSELIEPLELFHKNKQALFDRLAEEGIGLHRQLVQAEDNVKLARQKYYAAEWQADPAAAADAREMSSKSLRTSSTGRASEVNPEAMRRAYEEAVEESNGVQNSILRTKGLRTTLAQLEQLDHQRIVLTKTAMSHFVHLTADWLPSRIGAPVAEEIAPTIESIDQQKDIVSFCDKSVTGKLPGSLRTVAYDPVRDIPPSMKSLKQLSESGGGPIKSGWTYKEGHLVRNWKKRWCVLWPMNFKEEAVTGPSLYYFDDCESSSCPKGTLPIFGSTVRIPKKERKGHPWLVRIEDSKAGDGDEENKHDKLVFAVDTQEERDEWLTVLGNASRGESVQRHVTFGRALVDIVKDQQKRRPESVLTVPVVFMDVMHQLAQMQCFTTEGLFRVPGDNDDIQELQSRYELDEYCSRDFVDGAPKKARMRAAYDVHVWGSFLKGWIRSLKDPIITEDCYDEAIQIIASDAADADVAAQLQALLAKLPLPHATLVRHLTSFLSRVDPVASKMNPENLAIVFAPCLLRHPDLMVALANSSQEIAFTKLLIENGMKLGSGPAIEEEQAAYAAELTVRVEEAAAANDAVEPEAAEPEPEPEPEAEVEAEAEEAPLVLSKSASGFLIIEEEEPQPEPAAEVQPELDPAAEVQPEPAAKPSTGVEEGVPPD